MWEDIKNVHGKPRHNQSQGSVERANRDIEDMLATWMAEHNSTDWYEIYSVSEKQSSSFR
jgi:hypothetical protein